MKHKERIAELERRVAELEARPSQIYYQPYPWWGTTPPAYYPYGVCGGCGGHLTNGHLCPGYFTTTTVYHTVLDQANSIVEGAMS